MSVAIRALLISALFALGAVGGCGSGAARGDLLITADRIFDGRRLIERGAVLVKGDKIVWIGEEDDRAVAAVRVARLGDATVLPGFIDLHVHRLGPNNAAVTTVRDLGAPLALLGSSAPHPPPGRQRILVSGPMITVPGGYPIPIWGAALGYPVRSPEEARAAVRTLVRQGADVIKIALEHQLPMLSLEEVRAIVDEAHSLGRTVTAHVTHPRIARVALAGGVDELAHTPCLGHDPEVMRRLAREGVRIVGTLHVDLGCHPALLENARAFVAAGGELLYGSDFPADPKIPDGIDVKKLKLMVSAGLTPLEALAAGTAKAGEALGMAPLGSLVQGAPADLIAVGGDPLRDLDVLRSPLLVVAGGVVVVGAELVIAAEAADPLIKRDMKGASG